MGKKLFLLFITVFSFYTGVVLGNNFIDYVFMGCDTNIESEELSSTVIADNTKSENSATKDEESPNHEIKNTNDDITIAETKVSSTK